jgi:hypothetical protein
MTDQQVTALQSWYAEQARPAIAPSEPERIAALDGAIACLAAPPPAELPICFLGAAGVGKSTLLNALVGGHLAIVPQGGVGSLTTQPTLVRYGAERRLRATYAPRQRLHQLLFALERGYEAELRRAGIAEAQDASGAADESAREHGASIESAIRSAIESAVGSGTAGHGVDGDRGPSFGAAPGHGAPDPEATGVASFRHQASLLVLGTACPGEAPDPRYLIDALRWCLGRSLRWGHEIAPADRARLERVRATLTECGAVHEVTAAADLSGFLDEIRLHACGSLAPMIRTLEVWWDADVLRSGLVLVDLPGVGLAHDEYQRTTAEWIRRARAVVLVVDRAGVTEAAAELLRATGFLTSLLHDVGDPAAEVPTLMLAAVKLDQSATDAWCAERERHPRGGARRWRECFDDVCRSVSPVLGGQLRSELERLTEEGTESARAARAAVVQRVLADVQIHPMSPYEYRMLLRGDEDERPRITHPAESGVPAFVASLTALGDAQRERAARQAATAHDAARARALGALDALAEQWRGSGCAAEHREELLAIAEPCKRQLHVRHGQYRELLHNSMPRELVLHAHAAAAEALVEIQRHLRTYARCPWATVRAAVRRNGAYDGAHRIDLAAELTQRFEEPLAVAWTQRVLVVLRQATRELVSDRAALVGELLRWAESRRTGPGTAALTALHGDLAAQAEEASSIGQEAISALRERVKRALHACIDEEVRRQCSAFVRQGRADGRGVKARLDELLGEELPCAIAAAAEPAILEVLVTNFRRVERDLVAAFERDGDPVQQALDCLLASAASLADDASAREAALARATIAIASAPPALLPERPR